MKGKKILALLLAVLLVAALFTACNPDADNGGAGGGPENTGGSDGSGSAGGSGGAGGEHDEIIEIKYWCWDNGLGGQNTKGPMIEEAINAYVEEQIGVHVNFNWVASSDYGTQLTLALANNEQIDIADYFATGGSAFAKMQADQSILDITELARQYAAETIDMIGEEVLSGVTIDGRLYAIPTYRNLNSNWYIVLRMDLLDKLGMVDKARNMTTWAEFGEILQAVKDSDYAGYAMGGGDSKGVISVCGCIFQGEKLTDSYTYDTLGDTLFSIGTDQQGNVYNLPAMKESQNYYKMVKGWMDAGLLYPDAGYNATGGREMFAADTFAFCLAQSEFGGETSWKGQSNFEVELKQVAPGYLQTANVQKFGVFFPITGKETAAALRFANLLYTDAKLMNLITWGIEGETYEITDGTAHYKEGEDANIAGYHNNSYKIGNMFLTVPWDHPADFNDLLKADFLNCSKSAYLGLSVDLSAYDTQRATISAVTTEYIGQMQGGMYTDAAYQEYLSKLDAAGINDWVAIYQTAVDDFLR